LSDEIGNDGDENHYQYDDDKYHFGRIVNLLVLTKRLILSTLVGVDDSCSLVRSLNLFTPLWTKVPAGLGVIPLME
jgi:hypothetical protein